MKIKTTYLSVFFSLVFAGQQAKAQFIKIDDFANAHQGTLSGQVSDGPSNFVWQSVGTAATIIITNNTTTPGVGTPGSGTPQTTNSAVTTVADGAAYIQLPTSISTSSTVATFFMQFDMGPSQTANNINWDFAGATGSDGGGSQNQVELNANVPNRAGLTIRNGGNFNEMSADGTTVFTPLNSTVYNIWFVVNNSAKNFVVYMQDASPSGTDLPSLTRMQVSTGGYSATPGSFTTNAIAFRNQTAANMTLFAVGPGGGGNVPQYTYSLYEDPNSLDLTNPVTGVAPILLSPPVITLQPQSEQLYAGGTANFTVGATGGGLYYQWQTNGVSLADGGNISGSASSVLNIVNVSAANALNYSCVVSNANIVGYKFTNSAAATLTLTAPNGAYETAVAAANPVHFYGLDDTGDPSTGAEGALDYEGGDAGIYGANSHNGASGLTGPRPVPDGFPGFSATNYAAGFFAFDEPAHIAMELPWNLNTNTVTITAWIYPTELQENSAGIVFNRGGGSDVAGLNFSTSGNSTLGYTWNNDAGTTSWDSGLQPPVNQWSFVALVVTPTNAIVDMMNTNGLFSSAHAFAHPVDAFGGTTMIGDDSGTTTGARTFNGSIDEVAVFKQALTENQLESLFTNASGVTAYPPTNTVNLVTAAPIYPGQSAQFASINGGSIQLSYRWQLNGINLTDGANGVGAISGSTTTLLIISNLAVGDVGNNYNLTLVTSNSFGSFTSSVPAVLSVSAPNPSQTIYTLGFEASGTDWNTGTNWSDGNPASYSTFSEAGSTYQVSPGTLERTPGSTNAVFPGNLLVLEGDGGLIDGNTSVFATNTTTGELRLKQSGNTSVTNLGTVYADGGSVSFPDLQLNGGQLDNGTSSKVTINGKMEVLTNSAIYADSGANGANRTIQVNSFLTGAGTITYGYLSGSNYMNSDLVVSGTTNTFSGQWNVLQGTLLGSSPNSLGTNSITVNTNGALETTYNIYNPKGSLVLNGKMFLYTSDTFYSATVNGVNLPVGIYTFAQLTNTYPANFPATWPVQVGSATGTNTGTGSITVLATRLPQITQEPTPASLSLYPGQTAQFTASALGATAYQWWFTNLSNVGVRLSDGNGTSGSKSNVLTVAGVSGGSAGTYTLVVSNLAGSVASSNATLTILSPGSPTTIQMSVVETAGQDWDTGINWSDGNPASLSAYSEPGSTYEVLPGAVLLTPASPANTAFPGVRLVIDGGGALLLEHSGASSIAFQDLQLNGGSMDNGADGLVTLTGQIDIANNVTIYTDTNSLPATIANFDAPGGVGGANFVGLGAYADLPGNTSWNPVSGTSGTTLSPSTNSDGLTTSPITLTENSASLGVGVNYGSYDNSAGTPANTPPALEDNYLWVANNFIPNFVQEVVTNTINNVPAGTYNLYLYGNNGGNSTGFNGTGKQSDWGTTFTVSSDIAPATSLSTSNSPLSYTSNAFIQGVDYVVFSNVVVGSGQTISVTWTANTNLVSFAGANAFAAFNGFQLVTAAEPVAGPRPFKMDSLLTGKGTINYDAGDTNFISDLDIDGTANTFSGPWNVVQGALLGGAPGSLGTNSITVGVNGALETSYNVNNPNAALVLNGKMFLHTSDTFKTLTVNGVVVNAGTYTFAQLNGAYRANFPGIWPLQANSLVNTGTGQITVLSPVAVFTSTSLVIGYSGSNLMLTWTNGGSLQTTTNLTGPWTTIGSASSPYTITPTNKPAQFYRVHP